MGCGPIPYIFAVDGVDGGEGGSWGGTETICDSGGFRLSLYWEGLYFLGSGSFLITFVFICIYFDIESFEVSIRE